MSQNNRNRLITNRDIHILNTNIQPFFKEDMKIINEYREIVLDFNGLLQDKYNFDLNVSELPFIEMNDKRLTEKFTDEYIKNEYLRYFIEIRELTPLQRFNTTTQTNQSIEFLEGKKIAQLRMNILDDMNNKIRCINLVLKTYRDFFNQYEGLIRKYNLQDMNNEQNQNNYYVEFILIFMNYFCRLFVIIHGRNYGVEQQPNVRPDIDIRNQGTIKPLFQLYQYYPDLLTFGYKKFVIDKFKKETITENDMDINSIIFRAIENYKYCIQNILIMYLRKQNPVFDIRNISFKSNIEERYLLYNYRYNFKEYTEIFTKFLNLQIPCSLYLS